MTRIRKEKETLDPAWFVKTAKLAMKRGTALIFDKTGVVYGVVPKSGGSANVIYPTDRDWMEKVLSVFPDGAVFPSDGSVFGGTECARALRPYANLRLPESGGSASIDPVTLALHIKGAGATIRSSAFIANCHPSPSVFADTEELSFVESVPKDIAKALVDGTRRDDNRPYLKRVYAFPDGAGSCLGSSDGKAVIVHKTESCPKGFGFDPQLVAMHDIVGFASEKTETGATVNVYALCDGTTVVEKISGEETPNMMGIIARVFGRDAPERKLLLDSGQAIRLRDDLASLGLGYNDTWGGVLSFTPGRVKVTANGQEVAEFECETGPECDGHSWLSQKTFAKFASLGGDIFVSGDNPELASCEAGNTRMLSTMVVPATKAEG